jgi:hypothetical protein
MSLFYSDVRKNVAGVYISVFEMTSRNHNPFNSPEFLEKITEEGDRERERERDFKIYVALVEVMFRRSDSISSYKKCNGSCEHVHESSNSRAESLLER